MSAGAEGNEPSLPDPNLALLSGSVGPLMTVQTSHICGANFRLPRMPARTPARKSRALAARWLTKSNAHAQTVMMAILVLLMQFGLTVIIIEANIGAVTLCLSLIKSFTYLNSFTSHAHLLLRGLISSLFSQGGN